jgi:mono/diheme cytochrome c family protein
MRKIVAVCLATIGVIAFAGTLWSQNTKECGSEKFYSAFSSKCETATLQAGLGNQIRSFGVSDLRAKFPETELIINKNPAYEMDGTVDNARKYRGIRLRDLIASLLPTGEHLEDYVLATTCLDGYKPVLNSTVLRHLDRMEALIAYQQSEIKGARAGLSRDGNWELVTTELGIQSPAPFYLVWSQAEGTYPQAWPFQLNSLRLIKAQDYKAMQDRLRPASEMIGKKPVTEVEDGYGQFTGKCITCHQVNGFGGQKAKINLKALFAAFQTEEEARVFLEAVVKNPPAGMSEIRGIKLTNADIRHLAAYLRHMSAKR